MIPYALYVRFLITKGLNELDEVNEKIEDLGLFPISKEDLEIQFNFVYNEIPREIERQIESKKYEGNFMRWMKVLEVDKLWLTEKEFRNQETAHYKLVTDINYDVSLRYSLRALILKGVPAKDICQDVNNKFSSMLKPEHVETYQRIFWNPNLMSRKCWKSYISNKSCTNYEKNLLFICLSEGLESVKTYLELPTKADVVGAYQAIFTNAYQKVKQYMKYSDPESNREARAWISTMLAVGDKYKKYDSGDVADFGKMLQLEFEYIEKDFPSPDEMTRKLIDEQTKKVET